MTLRERVLAAAAVDPRSDAKQGIADAESWEHFATHVEPQPLGTPKYIFRTGHAIGGMKERERLRPLIQLLAEVAGAGEPFLKSELIKEYPMLNYSESFGSMCTAIAHLRAHLEKWEGE